MTSRPVPLSLTVTEKVFQQRVLKLAKDNGWKTAHFTHTMRLIRIGTAPDGKAQHRPVPDTSARGWPDIVMARSGVVLFRELKSETGTIEPDQAEWLAELQDAGLDAKVWRPRHWAEAQLVLAGYAFNQMDIASERPRSRQQR